MAEFDINTIDRNDQMVIGAGIVFLILSFFPWYHVKLNFGDLHQSASRSGWGLDGWCKLAIFLSLAAPLWAAAYALGQLKIVQLPVGPRLVTLALAAAALLVIVIRILTVDTASGDGASAGRSFPWFLAVLALIVQTAFAAMAFRESGEQLPSKTSTTPPPATT